MNRFPIIANRKPAIVAVHSNFFLLVAALQLTFAAHNGIVWLTIYFVVTTVLLALLMTSACAEEKL